jgi:hypothetical protein
MCYGLDKKCGNNIKKRSTFESTTVHNFHKGCWWNYLNLSSQVAQQTINCLTSLKEINSFILIFPKMFYKVFQCQGKKIQ